MADILKLLGVLALVIFLIGRKWNLGLILTLASLLLGLLFARPLPQLGLDVLVALVDPLTLRLAGIVVLILLLGEILRLTARLDGMVHSLEQLVPDTRIVMAVVPAFIGLLPMVGGAMFSAPMVDRVGDRLEASASRKTFVNYWFRHVWEYIFPLYPSFVLGAALLGLSEQRTALLLSPLFLASVAAGVLFGMLGLHRSGRPGQRPRTAASVGELLGSVWPIALVLALALLVGLDLILSLLLTILLLVGVNRLAPGSVAELLIHRVRWNSVLVIFGAMIFRRVLEQTGAVAVASDALVRSPVPVVLVVFIVPFVAGLLSGLMSAAFAIGFPIVLPLIGHSPVDPGLAVWAWAGGFLGVMMSPVHLCLALTRVYFDAEWGSIYRRLVPATGFAAAVAALLLLLL